MEMLMAIVKNQEGYGTEFAGKKTWDLVNGSRTKVRLMDTNIAIWRNTT
jgi:hypothetical protein